MSYFSKYPNQIPVAILNELKYLKYKIKLVCSMYLSYFLEFVSIFVRCCLTKKKLFYDNGKTFNENKIAQIKYITRYVCWRLYWYAPQNRYLIQETKKMYLDINHS